MKRYSITNWDDIYENNRTRGMKVMQWVPVPNKHDGEGFIAFMSAPNGTALYGAWQLILQVASKCPRRGELVRGDGTPHTAESIATKSRGDAKLIQKAMDLAVSVGWLSCEDLASPELDTTCTLPAVCPQSARSLPAVCPHPTDEEGRKEGIECRSTSSLRFPCTGKPTEWVMPEGKLQEYCELYPHMDALLEIKKALQWCRDNPRKRKTADGMTRFLGTWLANANNKGHSRKGAPEDKPKEQEPDWDWLGEMAAKHREESA